MPFNDAREKKRLNLTREIEYSVISDTSEEIRRAVMINHSDSGVGLYVFKPLSIGQELVFKEPIFGYRRTGIVRWCRQSGENIHRAGLFLRE